MEFKAVGGMVLALVFIVILFMVAVQPKAIDQSNHELYVGASFMTFWGTGMEGFDWSSARAL